jgi:fumarate reductase subunit D
MRRSHEPISWSLFGAGGMLLALIGPGLIVSTLLLPWLMQDPQALYVSFSAGLRHPLGTCAALAVVALPLYHTAHRLYHGLHDLHITGPGWLLGGVFYGGATVLSALCAFWLLAL